jgi:diguanylate cyclase (GGDEF)-like protein
MTAADLPDDETQRLAALSALGILDTPADESFDSVTRLAQRVFDVPIAVVSLVDRDRSWSMSHQGIGGGDTDREIAFCAHTILTPDAMVVENTLEDPRFSDNPFVLDDPSIRFYAGMPLSTPDGHRVGTLCVIDRTPRTLGATDLAMLGDLAGMIEHELMIRHESVTDRLTGLYNRRGLELAGERAVVAADLDGRPLSVLFADLDGMKTINDEHGHAAGDLALVEGADLLRRVFRGADLIARLGGDEFVVVLSGADTADVGSIIGRLGRAVIEFNVDSSHPWDLALSTGSATRAPRGETFEELLARADAAMYSLKRSRRAAGS